MTSLSAAQAQDEREEGWGVGEGGGGQHVCEKNSGKRAFVQRRGVRFDCVHFSSAC